MTIDKLVENLLYAISQPEADDLMHYIAIKDKERALSIIRGDWLQSTP